ncbi:MAG: SagB/ThcOx family dehydrogenase [gamma proteobacterium symbiont of Bathyaustriella thionipta]|nr:SagB/ThcOx family dehydrogenase [gamma proteobacterium symbiont of Bathyaustriella thionipta]
MTTATIRAYHQRTRHRLGAYARGPEYLDWDNQPDPFRRFAGAELVRLPLSSEHREKNSSWNLNELARLLELSMGLSAWKQFGPDRWALRCNPSSGNLHPTETYLVCCGMAGLEDGIYHYAPREHALERRATLSVEGEPLCLISLSSIIWREAWKYGERALRYVQLDVGHALGALRYAAAVNGWGLCIEPVSDTDIARLLGLDRSVDFTDAETEQADLLLQVFPDQPAPLDSLPWGCDWQGQANALGGDPYLHWPVVDQALAAIESDQRSDIFQESIKPHPLKASEDLERLIRQRRSAQSFIGKQSTLPLKDFYSILAALLPQANPVPWDLLPWAPRLHPVLFVHRVEGLPPGLYALPRHGRARHLMQAAMDNDFDWQRPTTCPESLPLYRLAEGDMRKIARTLSCHQEIASAGSFSLAMLAEFEQTLEESGAVGWRHLHWEAGLLGQVLYIEAEKAGLRGTGIGCFFDDSVHQTLGLADTRLQSLYHFTIGYPRDDPRLQTLPPYAHLGTPEGDPNNDEA